jgi:Zn ribbon nucleic-acid-binding protein
MFEVFARLCQLGMQACPVCRSANTLGVSPFPTFISEAKPSTGTDGLPSWEEPDVDLTFAVRVECTICGYLMLFNSQQYRTADEKILTLEAYEEHESHPGDHP